MKKFVLFTLLSAIVFSSFAQQPTAATLLKKAFAKAKKENKKVIVIFHAGWCGWCKKLDQSMNDESVKAYFEDNFVTTHITVLESPKNKHLENKGGTQLLEKYGAKEAGLPFFVFLESNGKKVEDSFDKGNNLGCPATEEEVAAFVAKLKRITNLSENSLQAITDRFRQNE